MTRRHTLLATVTAAILAAVAVASFLLLGDGEDAPAPRATATESAQPSPSPDPAGVGEPTNLRIPAIDVDAGVVPVGTTADNAQEVPASLTLTGWWRDGVKPGDPGNAVIVGHTASADDGVFDELVDVKPGDEVVVTGQDGRVTFRVDEVKSVPVTDFAQIADEVYRGFGPTGLVLMTCGDWNGELFETTVVVSATAA